MMKSTTIGIALLTLASTLSAEIPASSDAPRKIDVPAGQLTTALRTLAAQSGVEFVYSTDQLKGFSTSGVRTKPGQARVKRTPRGSSSILALSKNPCSACLAAA